MSGAYPWLVADIGGTNARFGWIGGAGEAVSHVRVLPVTDHGDPVAATTAYLHQIRSEGLVMVAPRSAAFAVATAVDGDQVELTNAHWNFSRKAVQAALGLELFLLLNDFEALALSLPRLAAAQLRPWPLTSTGPAHVERPVGQVLAVIGPGTGLGVAGVVHTSDGWLALPGEGGHMTLAPGDEFESAVLAHVRRSFDHVSAERLLSGIGLPTLHDAVVAVLGASAAAPLATAEIVERGLAGADAACVRTLDAFCGLLGSFAGNVALTLGSRGGVFIGGGIVPRLGESFFASQFRERFEAKGRFRSYLQGIPTALISDTLAALAGAAQALEQHRA